MSWSVLGDQAPIPLIWAHLFQTKLILVKDGSGQGAAFVAAVEYEQP